MKTLPGGGGKKGGVKQQKEKVRRLAGKGVGNILDTSLLVI